MARRTVEVFECDICKADGDRFTIQYPDGTKALDRCPEHSGVVTALKDEPGQWTSATGGRNPFQIVTIEEIQQLRE